MNLKVTSLETNNKSVNLLQKQSNLMKSWKIICKNKINYIPRLKKSTFYLKNQSFEMRVLFRYRRTIRYYSLTRKVWIVCALPKAFHSRGHQSQQIDLVKLSMKAIIILLDGPFHSNQRQRVSCSTSNVFLGL